MYNFFKNNLNFLENVRYRGTWLYCGLSDLDERIRNIIYIYIYIYILCMFFEQSVTVNIALWMYLGNCWKLGL